MHRTTILTTAALTLSLACGSLAATPPAGSDWPKWLGPDGDGICQETGLLDKWPTTGPERLWSVQVGKGYSSPVAADGKVFIYTMVNNKDVLTCLGEDGKEVWKKTYAAAFTGSIPARGPRRPLKADSSIPTAGTARWSAARWRTASRFGALACSRIRAAAS